MREDYKKLLDHVRKQCEKFYGDFVERMIGEVEQKEFFDNEKLKSEPPKELLFISEDGKNIYEGDEVWITSDVLNIADKYPTPAYKNMVVEDGHRHKIKKFSTREAAEKYITDNKPKKEPLFITEDGVAIYDRQKDDWWMVDYAPVYQLRHKWFYISWDNPYVKYFSDKSKAEEYIAKHKVQFSAMDFLKLLPDEGCKTILGVSIIEEAKRKLKTAP